MESLGDILGKYNPAVPDEVAAVKRYIFEEFGAPSSVGVQGESLVVTVASASLANALKLRQLAIKKAAGTAKRLVFRIG
ncbi:MAG TPA: hypothetical protein VLF71_06210 [Candidatus Saccharimonadales bacterium]|nr:hypothetical protein [Candidatus Saccharimonadales bacterium]